MDLYRLPADAAVGAMYARHPVDRGWARVIQHGPMTVGEVLERARTEMDEQDQFEEMARDPVGWVRAERRRRSLWGRMFGRGG